VGNVLGGSGAGPSTPSRRAAFPNFFSPRSTTTTPTAARVPAFVPVPDDEDVDEDTGGIDWTAVDADTLEAEALTPLKRASKSSASVAAANGVGTGPSAGSAVNPGTPASRLHERLVAAAGKRKREDGEGSEGDGESEGGPTPKRSNVSILQLTLPATTN
jgi:hypothetical protein